MLKIRERKIEGTRAKAMIEAETSGAETTVTMTVLHRGKKLFQKVLWQVPGSAYYFAHSYSRFEVLDGILWARSMFNPVAPHVSFPLGELPEEFSKIVG